MLIKNARIECSAKVLKELGVVSKSAGYGTLEVDPFFNWYAHLFYLTRKKCLLFVNCHTRYPVVALYLSRQDIQALNTVLAETLMHQLIAEGVPIGAISKITEHLHHPEIAKSKNRSIIGTAVEYERLLFAQLENPYSRAKLDSQTDLALQLARTPILVMKKDPFPYSAISKELMKRYGKTGSFNHDPFAKKPGHFNCL